MPDKYNNLRTKAKELFKNSQARYGYRRIHVQVKNSGYIVSQKVIRRIMKEEQFLVPLKEKLQKPKKIPDSLESPGLIGKGG